MKAGHSLHRWVDAGRHAGLSWSDVGEILGVSRQAAQQRFAQSVVFTDPPTLGTGRDADLICRSGMTAFNEVAVLEEEGRNGNELVGAGPLKLYFAPRNRPWENVRVTALALRMAAVIKRYEGDSWTHAVTRYPFRYFTRPAISSRYDHSGRHDEVRTSSDPSGEAAPPGRKAPRVRAGERSECFDYRSEDFRGVVVVIWHVDPRFSFAVRVVVGLDVDRPIGSFECRAVGTVT